METIYMSIQQVYLKLMLSEGVLRIFPSQLLLKLPQTLQPQMPCYSNLWALAEFYPGW